MSQNILDQIVADKRLEVESLQRRPCAADNLAWSIKAFGPRRDFARALRFPRSGDVGLIAEVKKASPSAGVIRADFDAVAIAREYEAAGASCLSILTDSKYFQGSLEYLRDIRDAVAIPLLRKDFIIHERQILEAVEWGADAILLIAAILDDRQLSSFHELARRAGMAALVEVHDEAEMSRALEIGATIIGVNNRDLKTFQVDIATSERLFVMSPQDSGVILVSESGIKTRADVERLKKAGASAILVGESLMREKDLGAKARELTSA